MEDEAKVAEHKKIETTALNTALWDSQSIFDVHHLTLGCYKGCMLEYARKRKTDRRTNFRPTSMLDEVFVDQA